MGGLRIGGNLQEALVHADSLSAGCRGVQNDRRADTNTSGDRSSARLGNAEKCLEFRVGWGVFGGFFFHFIYTDEGVIE